MPRSHHNEKQTSTFINGCFPKRRNRPTEGARRSTKGDSTVREWRRCRSLRVSPLSTQLLKDWQLCWFYCGRRTRPFSGRAFREQKDDQAILLFSPPPSSLSRRKIGSGEVVVHCACRTSTFLSCAFHEQEGRLTAPYPSFRCPILLSVPLQRRTILSLCLTQISVLTSNEKMKNSCLCSFTIATTGKHPKAASAPPDE